MTNEELCLLVQNGDTKAMGRLWEQNQALLCKLFSRYFSVCAKNHCEPDDLLQCGYFVICAAARAYNPSRGYKFTAYLKRHVQNAVADTFGTRGKKQRPVEVSGSTPIGEDEEMELLDALPDQCAADAFILAEDDVYTQQLHQTLDVAMERLTERQRAFINRRFYDGDTYAVLAADYGLSVESVRRDQQSGLCRMSRDKGLRQYRADILSHAGRGSLTRFRDRGASVVEETVEMLERFYRERGIPYTPPYRLRHAALEAR